MGVEYSRAPQELVGARAPSCDDDDGRKEKVRIIMHAGHSPSAAASSSFAQIVFYKYPFVCVCVCVCVNVCRARRLFLIFLQILFINVLLFLLLVSQTRPAYLLAIMPDLIVSRSRQLQR